MISVSEAEALVLSHVLREETCLLSIESLKAEILQEDLMADRPFPPFHRVAMDGIAIRFSEYEKGLRHFAIQEIQAAGEPQRTLHDDRHCIEVMTGAVLPKNCDTVIRVEDLTKEGPSVHLIPSCVVRFGQNVHLQGSDYPDGEVLLSKGTSLLAPQWAVAATIGQSQISVSKRPSVAVVSTGTELVEVTEVPLPHQIRSSNKYALSAFLKQHGFENVSHFHLADSRERMFTKLQSLLEEHDVVVLSGGVSMGQFDFVPSVLKDLGVQEIFHKVAQRPGKPFWFGVGPEKQMVFGLPGNPVSALTCLVRYLYPALNKKIGVVKNPITVRLKTDFDFSPKLTLFQPVQVKIEDAELRAFPISLNGSGDLASLTKSDGFIELPPNKAHFAGGEVFPYWHWGGRIL
ncbi:MAG: molybdopterin molybdotransferase MoeA [Bdellovibrionales bacterium]|nr:molybdopterin molybdotransferase MoeA [Bdellovibrionales bacterium]